jgi:hypothetical protein
VVILVGEPQIVSELQLLGVDRVILVLFVSLLRSRGVGNSLSLTERGHALEAVESTAPSLSLQTSLQTRSDVVLV